MMKRFVYLLICMLCPLLSWAQRPYLPFVEEGKKWEIEMYMPPFPDTMTYVIRGDTLIGDILAKKLYFHSKFAYGNKTRYECALFEDEGRVMCIPRNEKKPYILYQFAEPDTDLGVRPIIWEGEVVDASEQFRLKSLSWDYIENNGIRRIVQTNSMVSEKAGWEHIQHTVEWVEGIGHLYGPSTWTPAFVTGLYGGRLLSVTVGDRVDYSVTGVSPLLAAPSGVETLHGLDGRRLNAPPQHGVYLRNGKKVAK